MKTITFTDAEHEALVQFFDNFMCMTCGDELLEGMDDMTQGNLDSAIDVIASAK